jgi:hypothetical protein
VHGQDPERNFTELVSLRLADEKIAGPLDNLPHVQGGVVRGSEFCSVATP